jgi:hypothetical protein
VKRVVSVSLGSSKRDHCTDTEILGEKISIKRIGTDGDKQKAIELIRELDGKVDAFGMGGTDLYIYAGSRRYTFRESKEIAKAARLTPIVDGSGLKNTLERRVIEYLKHERILDFEGKKVLMVCAVDRFGMAEALTAVGCDMTFGDLLFGLGLPFPIKSLRTLDRLARILAPVITQLPIRFLYPTGSQQECSKPRYEHLYQEADIIAGDFHFIKKHVPNTLEGKIILTNTVTPEDIGLLKRRGVQMLITTTPEFTGRSFGTNVMEGVLVALAQKPPEQLHPNDYHALLDQIGFTPRIENWG